MKHLRIARLLTLALVAGRIATAPPPVCAAEAAAAGSAASAGAGGGAALTASVAATRGNAVRGRSLADTCVPCHGAAGVSESVAFPILAGQQYEYLVSAMLSYQAGTRPDSVMGGAIRTLSRGEIDDLAAYYASLGGLGATGNPRATGPAPGAAPSSTLAAAQAAADAARTLQPPVLRARPRGRDPDAVERRACAATADSADSRGDGGADSDGDGVADRDDAAPRDPAVFALDADGDGFAAICNAGQLRAIARGGDVPLQRNFELVADVDLGRIAFDPIGNCGRANNCMISRDRHAYAAHFDGNGHTIRGLRIARPGAGGVGLFGTLGRRGAVTRVVLRDAEVVGANGSGLLVGASFGIIEDCDVQGTVRGRVAIGGLTGGNAGRVLRSRADVSVEALAAAGGLVGDMNGTVESSLARVTLSGGTGAGGLVGLSTFGTILDSRAIGRVDGVDHVGGLVGLNTDALIDGSEADVAIEATGTNAGGAVGYSAQSVVRNVVARGAVHGRNAVGGLVGRNRGAVLHAYSTGVVRGETAVGGLVGDNAGGTLRGAYWDAATSGTRDGAGLARSSEQLFSLTADQALWDGADRRCRIAAERATSTRSRGDRATWMFDPGRDYPRLGCLPEVDPP